MKNSALLSLEVYSSDENNSSDSEATKQRIKTNSLAEVKKDEGASSTLLSTLKEPKEASCLLESELEQTHSLSSCQEEVDKDSDNNLVPDFKEPIEASNLSDSNLEQTSLSKSAAEVEECSDTSSFSFSLISYLKEPTDTSQLLDYELGHTSALSTYPTKVKKNSNGDLDFTLKELTKGHHPSESDLEQTNSSSSCSAAVEKNSDNNLVPEVEEPTEASLLSQSKWDRTDSLSKCMKVRKDLDNLSPNLKEPTEATNLSDSVMKKTDSLSSGPDGTTHSDDVLIAILKDPIEVICLSDTDPDQVGSSSDSPVEVLRDTRLCSFSLASYFKGARVMPESEKDKIDDSCREYAQRLDENPPETSLNVFSENIQSSSPKISVAARKKKCKERKSKKKHQEKKLKKKDTEKKVTEKKLRNKDAEKKSKKKDAEKKFKKKDTEKKSKKIDTENSSKGGSFLKSSVYNVRSSLVCNEYSNLSESDDSSEEGQCTTDDDPGSLQKAKASCFKEFRRIFDIPVPSIPLPKENFSIPTSSKKSHSMTKEDFTTPTPSLKRSHSMTKEDFITPTPSLKKSHSMTKEDFTTPSLKRSHSMIEDDSVNDNRAVVKMSTYHHELENVPILSLPPPPPPPEETSDFFSFFKRCPPPSLKRSHSMTEDDSANDNRFGWQKSRDHHRPYNFSDSNSPYNRERRSFPPRNNSRFSEPFHTPKRNYDDRRRSFPGKFFHQSNRACAADQTPYSPHDSYRGPKRMRFELPYYNPSDLLTFKSEEGFIDSHCHLDFLFQRLYHKGSFAEFYRENRRTFPECYKGCLAIFCNPYSFKKKCFWQEFLEEENIWASFGCHPHNAKDYNDEVEESLRDALEHPKVRALGEIGLDYSTRNFCYKDTQQEAFRRQLRIALEKKLPLVIHCREAHDDAMDIMKEMVPKNYFIHLHCFSDTWDIANRWLQEFPRLYIGLTNLVTFPTASEVHEVAKKIPLGRLLLETDAPYFVPKPWLREHPNEKWSHPGMAIHVAAQVAALKGGVPLDLVLSMTRRNTQNVYKI